MNSIEWLIEKLGWNNRSDAINRIVDEANEIHKAEIIDAVLFGMQKGLNINKVSETDNNWLNNYYKETFKK
jgi:hypothetical protein